MAGVATQRDKLALSGVYEISKLLSSPARLEAKLAGVLSLLSSFLDMRHGLVAFLNPDGSPKTVIGSGWRETSAHLFAAYVPERAIGRIVATRMALVIRNVADDALFSDWPLAEQTVDGSICSFIGVPIKSDDQVTGTLTIDRVGDSQSQFWLDEDVRFLTMIANLIGQSAQLHAVVDRDRDRLILEQHRLAKALSDTKNPGDTAQVKGIVGDSPAIRNVLDKAGIVAKTNSTVLLYGESGTGKELFARAIHDLSRRKGGAFIKLNCAVLPEGVLESELFGHEKGAFTGAAAQRKGRFELADGGTLFLDEIGEISPAFQSKLLRVLQEGEFERVGGSKTLKVDVRLVCATNRNLVEMVAKGTFRADLYYRIAVVNLTLPPLRERPGDVPLLANEFLSRFNAENGVALTLEKAGLAVLTSCHFPGNVRELENCVRRTATFAQGQRIGEFDFACRNDVCLSAILWKGRPEETAARPGFTPLPVLGQPSVGRSAEPAGRSHPHVEKPPRADLPAPVWRRGPYADETDERKNLIEALEASGWVKAKAARLLGISPRQIGYALRKYEIPVQRLRFAPAGRPVEDDPSSPDEDAQVSERENLIKVMEASGWVKAKAARMLGLTTRQVGYALQKHEIPLRKL
ncbi:nif-specific transcriptional activator NifA [Telmatospirillum sp.]|uniref:nif-specific transcriptional activator NifA n=1 Tax=Telmatospirillum sp. TaxID=2079197 RepID=UPI00284C971D|nr:nif-specific transcriptional activator NifA [Telmatospirillum sp.]MDR3437694.1 nif-specific transcriptional activator NifA [Telmatospirillum sp.]